MIVETLESNTWVDCALWVWFSVLGGFIGALIQRHITGVHVCLEYVWITETARHCAWLHENRTVCRGSGGPCAPELKACPDWVATPAHMAELAKGDKP